VRTKLVAGVLTAAVLTSLAVPSAAAEPPNGGGAEDVAATPRARDVRPSAADARRVAPAPLDDAASTTDATEVTPEPTDRVVVRLRPGTPAAAVDQLAAAQDAEVAGEVAALDAVVLDVADQDAVAVAADLATDPRVEEAVPDHRRHTLRTPNDPLRTQQPHLETVRARSAWARTLATGVTVAVVDTGVQASHPDLTGRVLRGYDFVDRDRDANDEEGHGTLVAGVVAANTNNGVGVAGVAWDARILPVRVLDDDGAGYDSDVAAGIIWAADQGAQVINLSLGGPEPSSVLADAVAYAIGKGRVVVAAAGNSGIEERSYPAALPGVVSVGATDAAGRLADFSTQGDWVTLAAPGFDVLSTQPTWTGEAYGWFDGTSAAAPVVAGVAALVRAQTPSLNPAQVTARLRTTARDAGPRGVDPAYGAGVVDATRAVGGPSTTPFALPAGDANEPNDLPARATPIVSRFECLCVHGTIAPEGDVDWYRYVVTAPVKLTVRVGYPGIDADDGRSMFPLVTLHDTDLGVLGRSGEDGVFTADESVTAMVEPGTYLVSVRNAWGSTSNGSYAVSIEHEPATAERFGEPVSTRIASWTEAAAFADVTGDGELEALVTASRYNDPANDERLHVLRRDTAGAWVVPGERHPIPGGLGIGGGPITVADLDDDGVDEVLVGGTAGVHRFARGEDGLVARGVVPGLTASVIGLEVADLDGDGYLDIVASTQASGIQVLWQDAGGGFTATRIHATGSGGRWNDLAVGDVTGDAAPEIVGVLFNSGPLQVLTWAGERTYRYSTVVASTHDRGLNGVTVGDATGDGRDDVVVTAGGNRPSSEVTVLPGGDAGFGPLRATPVRDMPQAVELADVTGDGRLDAVTLHGGWGRVSLLQQGGAGFLPPRETRIPTPSHFNRGALAIADLDEDGALDLGIATGNIGTLTTVPGVLPAAPPRPAETAWVRDAAPVQHATIAAGASLRLDLARTLDPASVTTSTVRLVDGRTGSAVAATRSYAAASGRLTITPAAPLRANRAYQLRVAGVRDTAGDTLHEPLRRYVVVAKDGVAPRPVTGLTAAARTGEATIRWTNPTDTDLERVVVRRLAGTTAPTATSGTFVYEGTGTSVVATGLTAGTDHAFGVFTVDESGNVGPRATLIVRSSSLTTAASATTVTSGQAVTVTGHLRRTGTTTGVREVPVDLLVRKVGTTSWSRATTVTTARDGAFAATHTPAWNAEYRVRFRGQDAALATEGPVRKVSVRARVTTKLSATSVKRGTAVTITGKVSPNHAGQRVVLQRRVDGTWRDVTNATLSSTSTYTFRPATSKTGTTTYRVLRPAGKDHAAGTGPQVTLKVT
jgi:type VII secretion-associated serine protease mycosin